MDIGGKAERVKVLASELASGMGEAGTVLDDVLTIACGSDAVRLTRLQRRAANRCRPPILFAAPRSRHNEARLMPRFRMTVEYDGSPYFGWQRQDNGPRFKARWKLRSGR